MERYVALLRGVNVGGNNKILMSALAEMFADAKCKNVRTYIQSGNVVFSADPRVASKLGLSVCNTIREKCGFQTTIVIRSLPDIERIAQTNPFLMRDVPMEKLYVVFLADKPTDAQVAGLDPKRSAPDEFKVIGSEIFLHLPNGAGTSKLTSAYFDARLKTVSTARNWRTLQKLLTMVRILQ